MDVRGMWRQGRTLLVVTATAVAFGTIGAALSVPSVPVAQAGVAQGNNDDKNSDKKDQKDKTERRERDVRASEADRSAEGQILQIDTLKNPPEIVIANMDGEMRVIMLKTDEIAINGVRLGDYVRVDGEKIDEHLFEAQQLSVSEHYSASSSNSNDNKKK